MDMCEQKMVVEGKPQLRTDLIIVKQSAENATYSIALENVSQP